MCDPFDESLFSDTSPNPFPIVACDPVSASKICKNLIDFAKHANTKHKVTTKSQLEWLFPIISAPFYVNIQAEKELKIDAFNAICRCLSLDIEDSDKVWWNRVVAFSLKTFAKIHDSDLEVLLASLTDCLHSLVVNAKCEYEEETWRMLIHYVYGLVRNIGFENVPMGLALATLAMIPFSGLLDTENLNIFASLSDQCSVYASFASAWQFLFTKLCMVILPSVFQFDVSVQTQGQQTHGNPNLKNDKVFEVFMLMKQQTQKPVTPAKGISHLKVLAFNGAFDALKKIRADVSPIFKARWSVDAFLMLFGDGVFDQEASSDAVHFERVVSLFSDGFFFEGSQWPNLFQNYTYLVFGKVETFDIVSALSRLFVEKPKILVPVLPCLLDKIQQLELKTRGSTSLDCLMLLLNIEEFVKNSAASLLDGKMLDRDTIREYVERGKITLSADNIQPDNLDSLYRLYGALLSTKERLFATGAEVNIPSAVGYMLLCSGDITGYGRVLQVCLEYGSTKECAFLIQAIALFPIFHPSLVSQIGSLVDIIVQYFLETSISDLIPYALILLLVISRLKIAPKWAYDLCLKIEKDGSASGKVLEQVMEQLKFALLVNPETVYTPDTIADVEHGRTPVSFYSNHCILSFFDETIVARTMFGILAFEVKRKTEKQDTKPPEPLEMDSGSFQKYEELRYTSLFDEKLTFLYDFGILQSGNTPNFRRIHGRETLIEAYDRLANVDMVEVAILHVKNDSRSLFECTKLSSKMKRLLANLCDRSIDVVSSLMNGRPKCPVPFCCYAEIGTVFLMQAYYEEDITEQLKSAKVAIIFNETGANLHTDHMTLRAELIIAISLTDYDLYKVQILKIPKTLFLPFGVEPMNLVAQQDLRPMIQLLLFCYRATSRRQTFVNAYEDRKTFLVDSAYGCTMDELLSYVFSSPQDDTT